MAKANGTGNGTSPNQSYTNYVRYQDPESLRLRIGHYDLEDQSIQPLSFRSGFTINNLYQVIEAGEKNIMPSGARLDTKKVKIKLSAPIDGRDILCVGKNYADHAKEFNSSGFDSSDKVDLPTNPVIFTKRFTSIIAHGDDIYPHPKFTETLDFEGEIGVIIGKSGFRISEANAMDHVWGYTIINDMTARERQRDHKQFYIGKSPDTFCPMGPIAVPAERLSKVLRVQTRVNGELRQNATIEDLIFSIPFLIFTMSQGQTLMPGDVLATGTPAGVGIGKSPPVFLKPGDEIAVSVEGLGTLKNTIGSMSSTNPVVAQIESHSEFHDSNAHKAVNHFGLKNINKKPLAYKRIGKSDAKPIVFVHGLGGTMDYWTPLISVLSLQDSSALHLFDLEGHGLSPTSQLSVLTIESFAQDMEGLFEFANLSKATIIAHSMGCLIATRFALDNPDKISRLILFGPPPSPLPEAGSKGSFDRAHVVRTKGIAAVVDAVVTAGTSDASKRSNPLAIAAVRLSLLGQDPEGYAKACTALAKSHEETLDFTKLSAPTLIVTGEDDKVCPPALAEKLKSVIQGAQTEILQGVGHWHNFEDLSGVAKAVGKFLS